MKELLMQILDALKKLLSLFEKSVELPAPVEQPPVIVPAPVPEPEPVVVPVESPKETKPDPIVIPIQTQTPAPDPLPPVANTPTPPVIVPPVVVPPVIVEAPVQSTPIEVKPPVTANRTTLRDSPIFMSCAFKDQKINDAEYKKQILKNFKGIVPENSTHMGSMNPAKGKFDFSRAEPIVKWALSNKLRVDATCLLWPFKTKEWVKAGNYSKDELYTIFKDYITNSVAHFKGKISSWVVVNEFLEDNGTYKDCPWYQAWGAEYVPMALKIAHEADPNTLLFLGEYGLEYNSKKVTVFLQIIKALQAKGVPIHGISSQMHSVVRMNVTDFNNNLKKFAATGLYFYVSELDVMVRSGQKSIVTQDVSTGKYVTQLFPFNPDLQKKHAAFYVAVGQGLLKYIPAKQLYGINVWSMVHGQNFMNLDDQGKPDPKDYPSMFEDDYTPNLAVSEFLDKVG